jgi:hypothetical protein
MALPSGLLPNAPRKRARKPTGWRARLGINACLDTRDLRSLLRRFSMLGNGLCETLCLSDINPAAVASCQHTVRVNKLGDRVSVYESDNLKSIPRSEMWNLIVSNPPHFIDQYEGDIRAHDPNWQIHRNFFQTVADHLAEDGVIVLQENNRGSVVETFRAMIEQSGFEIFFTHDDYPALTKESSFYFIGLGRPGKRPTWA